MLALSGPLRTEAIVLRSIRYGEADRILHLYTPDHGRLSAIAKGARRARSRLGARLEPFMRVTAHLHEGRSDLLTVTGVDTIAVHAGLREHAATLDSAARACGARPRGETMLATSQLETALANHEECYEAAAMLEHVRKRGHEDPEALARLFKS